eukprot:TRINITY_DN618_c0_g1_i2.p1 TRINITY_DN618_c0_g1~~TRINITY_DN618_c0_g1_i2.p1  ORF type:complete len:109 (-),score=14.01 TRINITY_DN618_c0_g1_i2:42-368(-)
MSEWLMGALGYGGTDKAADDAKKREESRELQEYTMDEVKKHTANDDAWMVINGRVYDVSNFIDDHPGGDIILDGAGRDATDMFQDIGHGQEATYMLIELQIGTLKKDE